MIDRTPYQFLNQKSPLPDYDSLCGICNFPQYQSALDPLRKYPFNRVCRSGQFLYGVYRSVNAGLSFDRITGERPVPSTKSESDV